MEIKQLNIDDKLTCLALAGSLDMGSVMAIKPEFARLAASGKPVLLEMSGVTFIASCGNVQVTVVPFPTVDCSLTLPSRAATACLTIAKPKPVPRPAVPLRAEST